MILYITNIIVSLNNNQEEEIYHNLEKNGITKDKIINLKYSKRSIDSRKRSDIKLVYNLEVEVKDETKWIESENIKLIKKTKKTILKNSKLITSKIVVIGAGPAGLFAAYNLCKLGYKPLIIERGEKIEERDLSVEKFIKNGVLDVESNIQFGEGGAGTYSDGKLNTRVKSGYIKDVFEIFIECGAQEKIFWDYKPHIGTDILKKVIINLRKRIIEMGGSFEFNSKLIDVLIEKGKIKGIKILKKIGEVKKIEVDSLILAIGHSSRDTYRLLHSRGIKMESKPFAIGARIEHPREFIDKLIYGKEYTNEILGASTYSLTYNNPLEKRGVFSFCMCPGGIIVNAASENGGTLVNGMSYSKRDGEFSNSAVVVAVREGDFGNNVFSGMEFQEYLEKKAYEIGGYCGLYQKVEDFINGKKSTIIKNTSYEMKLEPYDLNDFFPKFIVDNMKLALKHWNKIYPGFALKDAVLIGPETRTSSPVKILRDEFGESQSVKGIYPIGEGAGYAGGITSAAIDGLKIIDLSFGKN